MDNKLVNQIACVPDNTLVNCLPHMTVAIHILCNIQCSINTHSTMWSYEQLFKKDKADFNDYLILFDLDTYYVEKLQTSPAMHHRCDEKYGLFEVESSGLLLMQLPWLLVLKFPVSTITLQAFSNWWKCKLESQNTCIASWQNNEH